jgi:hypothetical protein
MYAHELIHTEYATHWIRTHSRCIRRRRSLTCHILISVHTTQLTTIHTSLYSHQTESLIDVYEELPDTAAIAAAAAAANGDGGVDGIDNNNDNGNDTAATSNDSAATKIDANAAAAMNAAAADGKCASDNADTDDDADYGDVVVESGISRDKLLCVLSKRDDSNAAAYRTP